MNERFKVIEFPHHKDSRGGLVPFELDESFPFAVKRVYLVTAHDNAVRGGHAHKVESEVFVAAQGTITALVNDGTGDKIIKLDAQNKALLVSTQCWHEFYNFSDDAVLLCFSSTHYLPGEENYITNKDEFLENRELNSRLEIPKNWTLAGQTLKRKFLCTDFSAAVELINQITDLAEEANHHPDIEIKDYKKLIISLTTHSRNQVTTKDLDLAKLINHLTQ